MRKRKRNEESANDENAARAYDLIMKEKEKLLSFEEPVRFIFSHSALSEGWDNPNIFQICTLKHSGSDIKKRQEVGRFPKCCTPSAASSFAISRSGSVCRRSRSIIWRWRFSCRAVRSMMPRSACIASMSFPTASACCCRMLQRRRHCSGCATPMGFPRMCCGGVFSHESKEGNDAVAGDA